MLSATIFSFSHLFYHKDKAVERTQTTHIPQASAEVLRLTAAIDAGVYFEAQPYLCPQCKQPFATTKKLNGHISGHKQKDEWCAEDYGDWELENKTRADLI